MSTIGPEGANGRSLSTHDQPLAYKGKIRNSVNFSDWAFVDTCKDSSRQALFNLEYDIQAKYEVN